MTGFNALNIKKMKAVILIRVSGKSQEDNHSLEAQKDKLSKYCKDKNFDTVKVFRIVE